MPVLCGVWCVVLLTCALWVCLQVLPMEPTPFLDRKACSSKWLVDGVVLTVSCSPD